MITEQVWSYMFVKNDSIRHDRRNLAHVYPPPATPGGEKLNTCISSLPFIPRGRKLKGPDRLSSDKSKFFSYFFISINLLKSHDMHNELS